MDGEKVDKTIKLKLKNYIEHKSKILEERVYWACMDIIFEAENYDDYEMDSNNNIYVAYSLKKEEAIINQPHDDITSQIIKNYRRNLKFKLTSKNFIVKYKDDEIIIYFSKYDSEETIYYESDSDSVPFEVKSILESIDNCDKNINIYAKESIPEFGVID